MGLMRGCLLCQQSAFLKVDATSALDLTAHSVDLKMVTARDGNRNIRAGQCPMSSQ